MKAPPQNHTQSLRKENQSNKKTKKTRLRALIFGRTSCLDMARYLSMCLTLSLSLGHSQTLVFYAQHLPWHFLKRCTPPSLSFYCVGSTTKNSFWHLLQSKSMATKQNRDEDMDMYGADFNTSPCTQQPTFSFPPSFPSFFAIFGSGIMWLLALFLWLLLGWAPLAITCYNCTPVNRDKLVFGGCVRTVAFGPWPWFGLNQHLFVLI